MKKLPTILAALLGLALAYSAVAVAKPNPMPSAAAVAKQECEALAQADPEAFSAAYGAGAVRACARAERPEAADALKGAAGECREQRGHSNRSHEAFRDAHRSAKGTNDAFGRCVSAAVKDERRDERAEFKNAAKECRAERGDTPESWAAFEEKYGTNKDDPLSMYKPTGNAFGKCVSSKVGNRRD
ncbi:MAG TPA: hypothetical protein VFH44_11710 [Solirubrobacterales bacterium]|nr:hypothetical protein [Solirubrobacterales bacterium]